jgi:hypothetical protein
MKTTNDRRRLIAAFGLAPLIVPVAVFIAFLNSQDGLVWPLSLAMIAAVLAYGGVAIFGIPMFWIMRARRWLFLWAAIAAGFLGGTLTWYVFSALTASDAGLFPLRPFWIWPGIWGAAVGAAMWLIVRPDRSGNAAA